MYILVVSNLQSAMLHNAASLDDTTSEGGLMGDAPAVRNWKGVSVRESNTRGQATSAKFSRWCCRARNRRSVQRGRETRDAKRATLPAHAWGCSGLR